MTTGGFILLIIFLVVYKVLAAETENQAKNYDYRKVSMGRMAQDIGKTQSYINRKMISGGYDKNDQWRI